MRNKKKDKDKRQQNLFELEQAKKELRESEVLQLSILNAVPHAVIGLKNREIIFANKSAKNVFGWKPKDLIGKNSRILYPSDKEFEKIGKCFYPELEKHKNYDGKFTCRRKDSTNIVCKITASRIGGTLKDKKIVVIYEDITERNKSEEILQKSQQEFSSLFNSSPEAAIYHDEKGVILNINPRFTKLFGYTLEELKGKNISEGMIFPRINSIKESEELTKLALEGEVITRETVRKKKDGSLVSVIISISPVITEGQHKGVIAFYQDITESKKIREELRKSKENYQILLENQDDLVTKITPEGKLLFVSPSYCLTYGKTEKELLGNSFLPLVHEKDRKMVIESMKELHLPPHTCYHVQRANTKKGWKWIAWADKAILDKNGKVIEIVCVGRDVTQQKEGEKALENSRRNFFSLFQSMPDGVIHEDEKGNILNVNPRFTKIFGYSLKELKGRNIDEGMIYPDDRIEEGKYLTRKAYDRIFNFETVRKRKDGSLVDVSISASPVLIENELQGSIVVYKDISKRKKNERLQEVLYNISKAANSSISLHEMYKMIHMELSKIINATNFYISLFDEKENKIFFVYCVDEKKKFPPDGREATGMLSTYIIKKNSSLLLNLQHVRKMVSLKKVDFSKTGYFDSKTHWLGVPLKKENKSFGVMVVRSYTNPSCYNQEDIKLMEFVSKQVANAIVKKKTEEKLQKSQEEFSNLFKNSPEAMIYADNESRIININPRFKELFGYTLDELKGKNIDECMLYPPGKINEGRRLTREGHKHKVTLETVRKRKDGSLVDVSISASPVMLKGIQKGALVLYQDISERKKTEEALRRSEEKFSSIFNHIPDAAFYQGTDGTILDINSAFTGLFGFTREDIIGKHIDSIGLYPPSRIKEGNIFTLNSLKQNIVNLETTRMKKDGSLIPVRISTSLVKINNKTSGIIALYQDISERKKAEKALRESEERFRALIESSSDIVQVVDAKGILKYVSPSVENILGYKPEDLIGTPTLDIVHPDDRQTVIEGFGKIQKNPKVALITITRCKHKDGSWKVLEGKSVNYLDNPAIHGLVSNTRDITERKADEQLKNTLYNISKAANSSISLEELYPLIHRELDKIIDATNFFIALYDNEKNKITFPYHVDELEDDFSYMHCDDNSLTGYVIKQKQSLLLNYQRIQEMHKQGKLLNVGVITKDMFWFGVPLKVEDEVMGVMAVQCYDNPHLYSEKDTYIMEFVSAQVATAIDRKKTDEALLKSQLEFSNLFNQSPEALVYLDEQSKIININPRFTELFGYSLEEIKGRNINNGMIHPKEKLNEGKKIDDLARTKGYSHFESIRRKKDGTQFPVLISGSNIMINENKKGIIGSYLDISERKATEKALEKSQKLFLSLFNSSPEAMVYTDNKSNIIHINPRFTELFGYSLEEIKGKNLDSGIIHSSEYLEEGKKIHYESLNHSLYCESVRIKKDGTSFPVTIAVSQVLSDGKFYGLIVVYQDISERKKLENELKRLAHYDVLTSACNRGYGMALIQQQLKLAKRNQSTLLLVYVDIDDFKKINDTFGHKEGDIVLKDISHMFMENLREIDIIIRIGGDEFLLLLPGSSTKDAPVIKNKFNSALNRLNKKKNKEYNISFTPGFSCFDPKHPLKMEELIQLADKRMYKEKKMKKIL